MLCPNSVAVDKSGDIYVWDFNLNRIRKIRGGIITTFAGTGNGPYETVQFIGDGFWPPVHDL